MGLVLLSNCSNSSAKKNGESEISTEAPVFEEEEEVIGVSFIESEPTYTWEEFAVSSENDVFPEDDLNTYYIYEYQENQEPIIVLISDYNNDIKYLLASGSNEQPGFDIKNIELPESSVLSRDRTFSTFDYSFFVTDIDTNGDLELVITGEINGVTEADDGDGTKLTHFVKAAVLLFEGEELIFNQTLTNEYNQMIGATEDDIEESLMSILFRKYYLLDTQDTYKTREILKGLFEDMDILSKNDESPNGFVKVDREPDGSFVIYSSFEGIKYFVNEDDHLFSEIDEVYLTNYPVMIDSYQMVDAYTFESVRIEEEEISMTLVMVKSEQEGLIDEEKGEKLSLLFQRVDDFWLMTATNNSYSDFWVTEAASKDFKRINDD